MRYIVVLLLITGCDVANRVQASGDVMSSKRAYTECLSAGKKCDAEKAIYEADIKAFNSLNGKGGIIENSTVINN